MHYKIMNGSITLGANEILRDVNFEIKDKMKIAVVGRNGAGKTTLLRGVAGEIDIFGENHDIPCVSMSEDIKIGFLKQLAFEDDTITLESEVKKAFSRFTEIKERLNTLLFKMETENDAAAAQEYSELLDYFKNIGGDCYEKEYETVVYSFGFTKADEQKKLSEFSGGQRTKIAFARLLLSKPDVLILDEPTNHLDLTATQWLEDYLAAYPGAILLVSHDRMFLDKVCTTVYEAAYGTLTKYNGNYSSFQRQKKDNYLKHKKEYDAQQKEIARLNELVDRFRYKATKAAMAQSKLKEIGRMTPIAPPERFDLKPFFADLTPTVQSAGNVLSVKELKIGYDKVLSTVSFEIRRGAKVGIIGSNGMGKSTFLKTLVGKIPALSGDCYFGAGVTLGYFDQQMASDITDETILENFQNAFPHLSDTEARTKLGGFLFTKDDVFKSIRVLSGGERVRLALCKIFQEKPNFLLLDEPTNHMDIVGKEALEEMLKEFSGTLICVSHDRYFLEQITDSLLVFEEDGVTYYPLGYGDWRRQMEKGAAAKPTENVTLPEKKEKKTYTTPLKELEKKKKRLRKIEEQLGILENRLNEIAKECEEFSSDYEKLSVLSKENEETEEQILALLEEQELLQKELE